MSVRSATTGSPLPMVATMPVFAAGNLQVYWLRDHKSSHISSLSTGRTLACLLVGDVQVIQGLTKEEAGVVLFIHELWPLVKFSADSNHPVLFVAGFLQVIC